MKIYPYFSLMFYNKPQQRTQPTTNYHCFSSISLYLLGAAHSFFNFICIMIDYICSNMVILDWVERWRWRWRWCWLLMMTSTSHSNWIGWIHTTEICKIKHQQNTYILTPILINEGSYTRDRTCVCTRCHCCCCCCWLFY